MNWFRRKKETAVPGTVQLRSGERHPFGMLADYVPLQNGELQLYRAVREAVPVVDAAIYKLIRMTGGVRATCQDAAAQRQLQTFLRTVPTGRGQRGINAFLDCYLDSLLVCGRAHRGDRSCQRRPGHRSAAVRPDGLHRHPGGKSAAGVLHLRTG